MPAALIFGGSGQIGAACAGKLRADGFDVTATSRQGGEGTAAYDPLVGDSAAASAASAFAGLASSLKKSEPMETSTPTGPTLDELARSLLRPMLKEWLDANLPGIVEAQVRKEVERIARSAG